MKKRDLKRQRLKHKGKKRDKRVLIAREIASYFGLAVSSIIIFVLFATLSFFHLYSGKIYPGISVLGIPLGGKTIEQSNRQLSAVLTARFPKYTKLIYKNRSWDISTASISASIDFNQTSLTAAKYGRKGSILGNLKAVVQAYFQGVDIPLQIKIDQNALVAAVASIAAEIDIPVEEPAIQVSNKNGQPTIEVTAGRDGRQLDTTHTILQIISRLRRLSERPIVLKVDQIAVNTSEEQLIKAKEKAMSFLGKTLTLKFGTTATRLKDRELIQFIAIDDGFDGEKISSYTATLAKQLNQPPQDALFQFENGKVTAFQPSKDGLSLDEKEATTKIIDALSDLEATSAGELVLQLPVNRIPPKVTTAEANNLGIRELLGQGRSYFKGSSPERIHNISLLTSRLNGILVAPGEIFSLAKSAGEISAATGYKQAYIIKNGRTVLGDGGGTCQPSTTLFRAALNAGLPIVERHPHSYRVSYYEQGGFDPGFDATIFLPQVDLKFKNDTPAYILIQAKVNKERQEVLFEIYGTKDDRKIYISPARIWDQTPPPPPLYQDDPTLPKGVIKQIDFAAWGAKVAFDYKVVKGNEIIQERTFYSNFQPWQAVYLRGTKEN